MHVKLNYNMGPDDCKKVADKKNEKLKNLLLQNLSANYIQSQFTGT